MEKIKQHINKKIQEIKEERTELYHTIKTCQKLGFKNEENALWEKDKQLGLRKIELEDILIFIGKQEKNAE